MTASGTPQRHCGGCGRPMAKAWAVVDEVRYCGTCYCREFRPVRCEECGRNMRTLRGATPARCKSCKTKGRCCLRCGKPVPVASLVMRDGVACPSCSRYFKAPRPCPVCGRMSQLLARDRKAGFSEPACEKCRRRGHRTCSVCHKHRPPAGVDPQGKAICRACLGRGDEPFVCPTCGNTGTPHSARRCEDCYWKDSAEKKLRDSLPLLSRLWARETFSGFMGELQARSGAHEAAVRFQYYFRFFAKLDALFDAPTALTPESLIAAFGRNGLRRYVVPHGYLLKAGLIPEFDDEVMAAAVERVRWQKMLGLAADQWYATLLRRFLQYEETRSMRYRDRGWRGEQRRITPRYITNAVRTAATFLGSTVSQGVASPQQIQQDHIDRFLVNKPGLRSPLMAFVRYLNHKERLFRPVRIPTVKRHLPPERILDPTRRTTLLATWLNPHESAVKESLICLLMILYAQTALRIVRIRLSDIAHGQDGTYRLIFGSVEIALHRRVGALMERYLAIRRKLALMEDEGENSWLFPGLNKGRHMDAGTVAGYYLPKYGVSAQTLFSTAIHYAYLHGLRHPKVLVKAFGITDQTAIKYLDMIDQRLRDEVEAKLVRG